MEHPKTLQCAWPLGCTRMANGYDHDHTTGRVRAALCAVHNNVLEACGDQASTLRAVADWLECADMGFEYIDYRRWAWRIRSALHRATVGT
jgi:hypothetical protein